MTMMFTMVAGELAAASAWAAHALPRRAQHPVLNGMLVEAGDDGVTFSAFDYETSRRRTIDVDSTIEPGRILLPGKLLAEVAKTLPKDGLVDFMADEAKATIQCRKAHFEILSLPVEDYPRLPTIPEPAGRIPVKELADAVARVAPAASSDTTLPMLSGIRAETGGGRLHLAGTDRYRIAWGTLGWEPTLDDAEIAAVIPAKTLADLVKGFPDGEQVEAGFNGAFASFVCAGQAVTVQLLDPEYPKLHSHYERFSDAPHTAVVDAAELAAVVRRVSVLARPSTAVRLSFSAGGCLVEAGDADGGAGREQTSAELDGGDVQVAFNPRYLLDALQAVGGRVRMRPLGDGKPCLFTTVDAVGEPDYWQVVMAIRLSS